ncbi:MAG TPA: tetratricopeptide repeat protein, partial [Planctomycetaceae bacterium]|nr:tetratricopeptide repeat protein [Planctomycetaceae bacterium]
AEQCFRIACGLEPQDQESVYGLGFCLERLGQMKEAIAVLHQAAGLSDDELSHTCVYQIGRCFLRLEQPAEAEAAFRQIAGMPAAAYQLAKLLIHTDRAAEAVPLLDEQLVREPASHKFLQLRARAAELLGDEPVARRCRDLEKRTPAGVTLEYGVSFITMYRSQYGLDRQLVECTRNKNEGRPMAFAGCLERALATIRAEGLVQFDTVYVAAAQSALALQDPDGALAILDEVRGFEYETFGTLELQGDALWLKRDREGARRFWDRSLLLLPETRTHEKLAMAWDEQDPPTAAAHRAAAQQLTGMRACHDGQIDQAHAAFLDAVELSPQSARNWYYLGETYRLRGDARQAKVAYARCLELDPDYERARLAQAWLESPNYSSAPLRQPATRRQNAS